MKMNRRALIDVLTNSFSEEELRTLTFVLGIDYDDLGGKGKQAKTRELIDWCLRHNKLGELIAGIIQERPWLNLALESVLGDGWEIHWLAASLKDGDVDKWILQNTALFITRESVHSLRTLLRTKDGQTFSGLTAFDNEAANQLHADVQEFPKISYRYTQEEVLGYNEAVGRRLYDLAISQPVRKALELMPPSSIDLVIEFRLQTLPWELMHDGKGYLCLKHQFGRRLVVESIPSQEGERINASLDVSAMGDRFCIVEPPILTSELGPFRETSLEADRIQDVCCRAGFAPVILREPTRDVVMRSFYDGLDVIHWIGHATSGGLQLQDGLLGFDLIADVVSQQGEVLFFLNACETGGQEPLLSAGYQLALSGMTVISPLSWVHQETALGLSVGFYEQLLLEKKSFGEALRHSKVQECVISASSSWWAYVLYGNPSRGLG